MFNQYWDICGIQISQSEVLLIGGYKNVSYKMNVETYEFIKSAELKASLWHSRCVAPFIS